MRRPAHAVGSGLAPCPLPGIPTIRLSRPITVLVLAALLSGRGMLGGGPALADQADPQASGHGPAAPAAVPFAVATKLEHSGASTRLSFDLSVPVEATATVVEDPDRVIVDVPQVNFQIDPAAGRVRPDSGALVRSFRFGLFAPGRSRIVIDLAGPATVSRLSTASIAGGDPSRLTIELARSDRATFHKQVLADAATRPLQPAQSPASAAPPAVASADGPVPVVVIDPGHGGVDPGASGLDGAVEKGVVLDFATVLAAKLKASGRYHVVMTRDDDTFVSLGDRVRIAREAQAALFVSVHADTLAVSGGVTGATVYTASDKASDAEAARVADEENRSDSAAGVEAAPDPTGVNDILFDLTRRETRTYAHFFQRTLVGYWQKIARLNKNPERAAGFKVLQAPDVPSVLLELGYLSSDKDVKSIRSPEWRDQATSSVVNAIDAFFSPRRSTGGVAVGDRAASQLVKAPAAAVSSAN